ncbi:MAG: glycosyltransferase family A protein [Acidobacteriota bacterium]
MVIPTYNRADLLRRTLESVFAQEFKDFEVIVVNDGSTDHTEAVVGVWGSQIQLVRTKNCGPGAARNVGINHSRGEYVAFLDSDDLWFSWTLQTFAGLIFRHDRPAILSASLIEFTDERELSAIEFRPTDVAAFSDYFASSQRGYFVGAGMAVVHRQALQNTSGFTERRINAEDHDLILRLGTLSGFVQVLAPVTLGWRRHAESATKNFKQSYDGNCYLIEQELQGAYPGGQSRLQERREIISRHVRPATLEYLRHGLRREAWGLYRMTFRWQSAAGRWKFLMGFPVKAMFSR